MEVALGYDVLTRLKTKMTRRIWMEKTNCWTLWSKKETLSTSQLLTQSPKIKMKRRRIRTEKTKELTVEPTIGLKQQDWLPALVDFHHRLHPVLQLRRAISWWHSWQFLRLQSLLILHLFYCNTNWDVGFSCSQVPGAFSHFWFGTSWFKLSFCSI